jgi:hypothetical protein
MHMLFVWGIRQQYQWRVTSGTSENKMRSVDSAPRMLKICRLEIEMIQDLRYVVRISLKQPGHRIGVPR